MSIENPNTFGGFTQEDLEAKLPFPQDQKHKLINDLIAANIKIPGVIYLNMKNQEWRILLKAFEEGRLKPDYATSTDEELNFLRNAPEPEKLY